MSIGENIALRRKELGITQEELAHLMGYKSKSTINKIELGINDIPQSKVIKFAEVLNTTVAYLMDWEGQEKKSADDDGLSENKKKLLKFIQSVPEDKAELVLRVMRSIVEND